MTVPGLVCPELAGPGLFPLVVEMLASHWKNPGTVFGDPVSRHPFHLSPRKQKRTKNLALIQFRVEKMHNPGGSKTKLTSNVH